MKLPQSSGGDMIVHLIDSPEGQAELASHGLITYDLITAIKHFQVAEGIRVGTLIGVNEQGFFGAKREGWLPDQPDAFSEPLISIPWVQILEYLERAPTGRTGRFRDATGRTGHEPDISPSFEGPEWIERESVTLQFTELRPSTIAEIIDCLSEQNPVDARIFSLRNLYKSLRGKELG